MRKLSCFGTKFSGLLKANSSSSNYSLIFFFCSSWINIWLAGLNSGILLIFSLKRLKSSFLVLAWRTNLDFYIYSYKWSIFWDTSLSFIIFYYLSRCLSIVCSIWNYYCIFFLTSYLWRYYSIFSFSFASFYFLLMELSLLSVINNFYFILCLMSNSSFCFDSMDFSINFYCYLSMIFYN